MSRRISLVRKALDFQGYVSILHTKLHSHLHLLQKLRDNIVNTSGKLCKCLKYFNEFIFSKSTMEYVNYIILMSKSRNIF